VRSPQSKDLSRLEILKTPVFPGHRAGPVVRAYKPHTRPLLRTDTVTAIHARYPRTSVAPLAASSRGVTIARTGSVHPADHEHDTVLERKELSARQVHAALRLEGQEEIDRSTAGLFWSAVACGMTLGVSLLARAVLQHHLPDTSWRPLVAAIGYGAGFIAVELGRQELYTGNTLTAALPFAHEPSWSRLTHLGRVWVIVLAGNLIGAAVFALGAAWTTAFAAPLRGTFSELGQHAVTYGFGRAAIKGLFGGWLIALMIWLMPGAHHARIWVIALVTWVLAATELTHLVAGSVEVFVAVFSGVVPWSSYWLNFFLPVLLGNTAGGVFFVALLNHLQVSADEPAPSEQRQPLPAADHP
jgi:formate/nitrite transporter FocA (FNT family)